MDFSLLTLYIEVRSIWMKENGWEKEKYKRIRLADDFERLLLIIINEKLISSLKFKFLIRKD